MEFSKIPPPVTEKMVCTIEIELNRSRLTPEEAAVKIQLAMDWRKFNEFSAFILAIMRLTRSSTYEVKKMEIV